MAEPATTPVRPFLPKRTKWVNAADQVTQHYTGLSLPVSWLPAQWAGAKKSAHSTTSNTWEFGFRGHNIAGSKVKRHSFQDYKVNLQEDQVNEKMRGEKTDTRSIKLQGVVWLWLENQLGLCKKNLRDN